MPATSGRVKMPSDNRMNVQVRGSNVLWVCFDKTISYVG